MPTEELKTLPKLETIIIEHPKPFDLIIVGGGPAGLSAGMYATRSGFSTLLIEKTLLGGQVSTTDRIENYPGFLNGVSGMELTKKLEGHAKEYGLKIIFGNVTEIRSEKKSKLKEVIIEGKRLKSKALIIATGTEPKKLNVAGEREFRGRGVSYCATCDGPLYKDKKIIVVGGGDAAVEEALFLTRFASLVTIVHRRDKLRADAIFAKRAMSNQKIYIAWNSVVEEIFGKDRVEGVTVKNVKTEKKIKLAADGIFIYVGYIPNTGFLKDLIKLDSEGYIITDNEMKTNVEGVFAAGDVCSKDLRQIVTAASDGAIAANSAKKYIEEHSR